MKATVSRTAWATASCLSDASVEAPPRTHLSQAMKSAVLVLLVAPVSCFVTLQGSTIERISITSSKSILELGAEKGEAQVPKGFGRKREEPVKREKSKSQLEREKASQAYDQLASKGVPEYNIFVKIKGKSEKDWVPAGTMAIPRTEKIANAVFEQKDNLLKGVYRLFPKLQGKEFDFGYNLKVYPDDPIKPLEPKARSQDGIKNWFEGLLNPLNAK